VLFHSVVNNFQLIISFSFKYKVLIIVYIAFEILSSKLDLNQETSFYYNPNGKEFGESHPGPGIVS